MSAHRTTRATAVSGLPAAQLVAANGGTVTHTAPRRRVRGRAAVLAATAGLLLVTGTGVASARPVTDSPTAPYCGPGYYPWAEYHACHKIKHLTTPSHQVGGSKDGGAWGLALLGLLALV